METAGPPPLLLLVDDEREILVALTDLLEDRYRVIATGSPVEAIELVAANPDIAVIVSDQRMPELTGSQFLTRIRGVSDAEAILLTGYADLSAVVSALNDGAISGYANKPWDADALGAMIDAAAERFALRRALAFERAAFDGLMRGSPDRIAIIDRGGRVVRGDGVPDERDLAALAEDRVDEEDRHSGDAASGERWAHIQRIPFGEPGHRFLLRIERDDTERRLAQRRRHQSEKLEALGTLAGGIAHDFNNLLAAILGNLELATRRIDDADRLPRHLSAATEAAGRGSAITRRLLSFSRQRDLAAETFRPDAAIRAVEELIVRTAAARIRLSYDFADPTWSVHTDPGQFELAILNLAINARDAMGGEGVVGIATANIPDATGMAEGLSGPFVRISVSDTGTGIDEAVRARVFEPFFTTKAQGVGTGLGLPMVRAMAQAAGGDVTIDSTPGEGTTIHLWLPCVAAEADAPPAPPAGPLAPHHILLVEDDAEVRDVVTAQLEAMGHRVTAESTAAGALARLERCDCADMIITDYAMPALSGVALAERVQACCPGLPVLLITGFAEIGGAIDLPVLTKPFSSEQLQAALVAALGPAE
ncbi:response regulator [Sphingomonas silueang]|uniref:response regulator n=1 Tax=Sphingomonas silueang TaxID=3156617 RepID=UPI0032B4C139